MNIQLIEINKRKGRRFSPQQKLQILKEWELSGNGIEVAGKNQLHPQTLYRWRKALEQGAGDFSELQTSSNGSKDKRTGRGKRKLKEALTLQTQKLMLLKKG